MGITRSEIEKQMALVFSKVAPEIDFAKLDPTRPLFLQTEIDSYDFMTILSQLETSLGVRIPDSVVRDSPNLSSLIDYFETNAGCSKSTLN